MHYLALSPNPQGFYRSAISHITPIFLNPPSGIHAAQAFWPELQPVHPLQECEEPCGSENMTLLITPVRSRNSISLSTISTDVFNSIASISVVRDLPSFKSLINSSIFFYQMSRPILYEIPAMSNATPV